MCLGTAIASSVLSLTSATAQVSLAHPQRAVVFERIVLDGLFRSEGVAAGDVDRDGDLDVLVGELWYEAPTWTRHEIAVPGNYDPEHGSSSSFHVGAFDVDGDQWIDEVVVGFPGAPCHWFRNPQGAPVHWAQHEIAPAAGNESPLFVDVDRDGRLDLVIGDPAALQLGWLEPRPNPNLPWRVHALSQPGQPGFEQYYHGLGFGDVDGDGRRDVLTPEGWYAGPLDPSTDPLWTFQPVDWLGSSAFGDQMAAQMPVFDVDGDGDQDVVTSSPHAYGLWWWERTNAPGYTYVEHSIAADFSQTHALAAHDIDGDGDLDLVTGKRWHAHGPTGDPGSQEPAVLLWFELRRGPGPVEFRRHKIDPQSNSGVGTELEVVDLDGDGWRDVVVANKKGVFFFRRRP